jgi:hypothetical protein
MSMKSQPAFPKRPRFVLSLSLLTGLALLLRLVLLGTTFQRGDDAELAARIVHFAGYTWTLRGNYGVFIILLVKLFVGSASQVGVTITEFWWKFPIALVGTLQVPLTYCFVKRLGGGREAALGSAAAIAILPIHVMQSRYPYGYEVLGVFFVTLALWALLDFYADPTWKRGFVASIGLGAYLLSHGYVVPVVFCVASMAILFAQTKSMATESLLFCPRRIESPSRVRRFGRGIELFVVRFVWFWPAVALAIYAQAILHMFRKRTAFGLFLPHHLPGFIGNIGLPMAALVLVASVVGLLVKRARSNETLFLLTCGTAYLAPLFFAVPPGITVIRGYMLMGTCFLVLNTIVVIEKLAVIWRKRLVWLVTGLCLLATAWGTVETVFGYDGWFDPTLVRAERGCVAPDPGSKAAGYLVREHVPDSATVLSIHRNLEVPNMLYYFGRLSYSHYDLSLDELDARFLQMREQVDVVICEAAQIPLVESSGEFEKRVVLYSEGVPRMWIYARPGVDLPNLESDVAPLNRAFDEAYAWEVRLW